MLNLSDKELDRFSKEAAQEYEPGEVLGERAWERLEVHLDRDLGRVSPNPLRHIRRFPFYYAPALLVLLGVSYYMMRRSSGGSPPLSAVKAPAAVVQHPLSSQPSIYTQKSTPASPAAASSASSSEGVGDGVGSASGRAGSGAAGTGGAGAASSSAGTGGAGAGSASGGAGSASTSAGTGGAGAASSSAGTGRAGAASSSAGTGGAGAASARSVSAGASGVGSVDAGPAGDAAGRNAAAGAAGTAGARVGNSVRGAEVSGSAAAKVSAGKGSSRRFGTGVGTGENTTSGIAGRTRSHTAGVAGTNHHRNGHGNNADNRRQSKDDDIQAVMVPLGNAAQAQPKELGRTPLQGLRPTKKAPFVNDSALRAFTLKSTPPPPVRKSGLRVNRSLTFGVVLAPDFASVNALAGDRPGSTIGLTADYQFANHLYIGSGLLLDRKIFSARSHDFHAPAGFYQSNGLRNITTVKGSFEMLEIPLNLRYDFSVTGSTLFFISSGLSSYLLTSENNNYYSYNPMTRQELCMPVSSPNKSYLFSALNFSLGVETGLTNSLSLLIAPYMKVPLRGVGVGQMQMNTVGINFSLRFAPVISRKRY